MAAGASSADVDAWIKIAGAVQKLTGKVAASSETTYDPETETTSVYTYYPRKSIPSTKLMDGKGLIIKAPSLEEYCRKKKEEQDK